MQPAPESLTPWRSAAEVAADLVLCGLNLITSTPAFRYVNLIQRPIVSLETALCGFIVLINNFEL